MIKTIQTEFGTFSYQLNNEGNITITGYGGTNIYVVIPEMIEGMTVTAIGDKAFLSNKTIEKLVLCSQITYVGDWAFAHMKALNTLRIPMNPIQFGKQVFMDCDALACIEPISDYPDPYLPSHIAAVIQTLKDSLLLDPTQFGSDDWYQAFDIAVLRLLERPDDDGFEPVFYGWFEDEDMSVTQHPAYIKKRRLEKASLSLNRLISPIALDENAKAGYESYIRTHMLTGVWDFICLEKSVNNLAYIKMLLQLSCITQENIDSCLQDLVAVHASEAAALLLQYKEKHFEKKDFFSGLNL